MRASHDVCLCLLSALTAGLSQGCILGAAAPPGRADIGPALFASNEKSLIGVRFSAGMHLASAFKERKPYDLAIGYVLKTGDHAPLPPDSLETEGPLRVYHGAYFEADYGFQLGREPWSRAWVGGRGEVTGEGGWAFVGRLAWESSIFTAGTDGGGNGKGAGAGIAYGRLGYGFFVESGYQSLPEGRDLFNSVMLSAGLTLRFPAFAFAGIVLP